MVTNHPWKNTILWVQITCALTKHLGHGWGHALAQGWGLAMPWPSTFPSDGPGPELHSQVEWEGNWTHTLPCSILLNSHQSKGGENCCKTLEFMTHSLSFPVLYIIFTIFSWIPQPLTTTKGQVYLFHSCSHPIKICFQKCWINSHWVTSFLQVLPSPKEICIITGSML